MGTPSRVMSSVVHAEASGALAPPPTDHATGLTAHEAQDRLQRFGANVIDDVQRPAWRQLAGKFWGPVPWMLEAVIVFVCLLDAIKGVVFRHSRLIAR